jgi:hypothetical protein
MVMTKSSLMACATEGHSPVMMPLMLLVRAKSVGAAAANRKRGGGSCWCAQSLRGSTQVGRGLGGSSRGGVAGGSWGWCILRLCAYTISREDGRQGGESGNGGGGGDKSHLTVLAR